MQSNSSSFVAKQRGKAKLTVTMETDPHSKLLRSSINPFGLFEDNRRKNLLFLTPKQKRCRDNCQNEQNVHTRPAHCLQPRLAFHCVSPARAFSVEFTVLPSNSLQLPRSTCEIKRLFLFYACLLLRPKISDITDMRSPNIQWLVSFIIQEAYYLALIIILLLVVNNYLLNTCIIIPARIWEHLGIPSSGFTEYQ